MVKQINRLPAFSPNEANTLHYIEYSTQYFYPLCQGVREESQPIMKPGQVVRTGDIIAKKAGKTSVNIHSAVGGEIAGIHTIDIFNKKKARSVIEVTFGGRFHSYSDMYEVNVKKTSLEEIIEQLEERGFYDSDMVNFSDLLLKKMNIGIEQIIVNAIEQQPYSIIEEKILSLHIKKITLILDFFIQMCRLQPNSKKIPEIICNSTNSAAKKNLIRQIAKSEYEKIPTGKILVRPDPNLPSSDYHDSFLQAYRKYLGPKHSVDLRKVLVIKPSTLLLLCNSLFFKQPFIEKYIQVTTSYKTTYFLKAFIGTPLISILRQLQLTSNDISHFLYGNLDDKNTITKLSLPVTKEISHFFALTEEQYKKFHKKILTWNK